MVRVKMHYHSNLLTFDALTYLPGSEYKEKIKFESVNSNQIKSQSSKHNTIVIFKV